MYHEIDKMFQYVCVRVSVAACNEGLILYAFIRDLRVGFICGIYLWGFIVRRSVMSV